MDNLLDQRLLDRTDKIQLQLEKRFNSSIHLCCPQRRDSVAFYRFLENKKVTEDFLSNRLYDQVSTNCKDKKVLVLCDTTEFNFKPSSKRLKSQTGLGSTSNNDCLGFFLHGALCVDFERKVPLGWAYAHLFNRAEHNIPLTSQRKKVRFEEKESYKWLGPSIKAKTYLKQAEHMTFVMDREGDIYQVAKQLTDCRSDVVIRSKHNRRAESETGQDVRIYNDIASRAKNFKIRVNITDRKTCRNRKKKRITCGVKYASYKIKSPTNLPCKSELKITLVQVEEMNVPAGVKAIKWNLITTKVINSDAQALEVIEMYKVRWQIEEMFRLLKTEGFNLGRSELSRGTSIRKLLILGMETSIKIKQLQGARDGNTSISIEKVFTKKEIKFMYLMIKEYEGETELQKNPYDAETLPWAAWLIARIGGWKGYRSQRPPGTITFKRGYEYFQHYFIGFSIQK